MICLHVSIEFFTILQSYKFHNDFIGIKQIDSKGEMRSGQKKTGQTLQAAKPCNPKKTI